MAVLTVLVGIGWAAGFGLGGAVTWVRDAWPDPVPQLAADKVAVPAPEDVGGPSQACPASSLTLLAAADATEVLQGRAMTFDLSVTNSGRRPCVVDVGDAHRHLVVRDEEGSVVFDSAHCADSSRTVLLGPGDGDRPRTIRWTGRTSVAGSCTQGQDIVAPGTYTAQVVMANLPDAVSEPVTITVAAPEPEPTADPDPTATATAEPTADPTATAEAPTATP